MKAPKFRYVRVDTLERALELLDRHGEDARILAGGQSLMPTLNMRLSQPDILIDINRLEELKGISAENGRVRIGALARHAAVLSSPIVARDLPLIAEAMPHVAHVAVRNRGTFGGSIALADPAAELPACVVALDAMLVVQSVDGRREIPARDYFKGLYETERRANELLIEARIPVEEPGTVSVFMAQTFPIGQSRESAPFCSQAEALESAQRHVFFIRDTPRCRLQLSPCQSNHLFKVDFPQLLRRG